MTVEMLRDLSAAVLSSVGTSFQAHRAHIETLARFLGQLLGGHRSDTGFLGSSVGPFKTTGRISWAVPGPRQ